jgi:hypothetical protein
MFLAAFSSLSITQPHLETCLLVDSIFFTIAPQIEHSWLVYCGFTATVTFSNTIAKYSIQTRNWYPDASLIDLARQGFFTIFLILKSTEALKSLDAHYAPCKFYCMMQYHCLLILRWLHPRICLARAPVLWTFNPPRHDPVTTFEDFFTLTQESRILNHYPFESV